MEEIQNETESNDATSIKLSERLLSTYFITNARRYEEMDSDPLISSDLRAFSKQFVESREMISNNKVVGSEKMKILFEKVLAGKSQSPIRPFFVKRKTVHEVLSFEQILRKIFSAAAFTWKGERFPNYKNLNELRKEAKEESEESIRKRQSEATDPDRERPHFSCFFKKMQSKKLNPEPFTWYFTSSSIIISLFMENQLMKDNIPNMFANLVQQFLKKIKPVRLLCN
eukprot:TRINITY_DN7295_c0_g1_i1.p1 TRINITY_DN7295_c0_g1~~TRINITY_DN7295_c0_g1_i1.p1  ORF type:complete len:252 (+),score=69.81 TRINITY_DN7295_c0_g1_i1:77-757(+)